MMKCRKIVVAILALGMAALLCTSCTRKQESNVITAKEIGEALVEQVSVTPMARVQEANISARFDIEGEALRSSTVYVSVDANAADEIAVFQVKEKQEMDLVFEALSIHNNQKAQTFKLINSSEYQKVRTTVLVRRDEFVIMATCAQPSKATAVIDRYFPKDANTAKSKK